MKPINEDALKLHKACVKAAFECPQFAWHNFYLAEPHCLVGNNWFIQSMDECLRFWSREDVLWKSGYAEYLPEWALNEFSAYCSKIGYRALSL